eukprot:GEZU01013406.1.p1 GENE.GEZU01013406.1~~GEZU01013406.1.p1  ORF type:complete len:568 (+),score=81.26 GEZU01013406.1:190-1893(+)
MLAVSDDKSAKRDGGDLELGGNNEQQTKSVLFNPENMRIKQDIIRMIIQYLKNEGYTSSMLTIQDEANVKLKDELSKRKHVHRMKKAILAGDWTEVERLCQKKYFKNYKTFLYAVYKQQYLELIESGEYQKAFTYLTKRLKPLESVATRPGEFKDLCYLLTCKSVQEAPSFSDWDGVLGQSREKLVEQFQMLLNFQADDFGEVHVPPNRLLKLLEQAVTHQVEETKYHPKTAPEIKTLLTDYSCYVVPNALHKTFKGHKENVKCVTFVGDSGNFIASGSSDNTVRLWNSQTGGALHVLEGHSSRVWDITTTKTGNLLASASGDSSVKIWDISSIHTSSAAAPHCKMTLTESIGDVYATRFHPAENHIVSAGYDKIVRLYDVRTGELVRAFTGHTAAVCSVLFNPYGNLVVSGAKDNTIKFWDIVSGMCVKTFTQHLGEVTSIEIDSSGTLLLSSSKDNSNRLWDLRTSKPIRRFKGHQNTYKNLVRTTFGPSQGLIVGGSEDGYVYLWDLESGEVLQKLGGHKGTVFQAVWNSKQGLLASCADDNTVKTWYYDESVASSEGRGGQDE